MGTLIKIVGRRAPKKYKTAAANIQKDVYLSPTTKLSPAAARQTRGVKKNTGMNPKLRTAMLMAFIASMVSGADNVFRPFKHDTT